jgi:hypothetical protein
MLSAMILPRMPCDGSAAESQTTSAASPFIAAAFNA